MQKIIITQLLQDSILQSTSADIKEHEQRRYGGDKGNVQCATCDVRHAQERERLDSMMAAQQRKETICQNGKAGRNHTSNRTSKL
jgi:hypothetical protein